MGVLPAPGGAHTAGIWGLLSLQLALATSSPSPQPLPGRKAPPPESDPLNVPAACGGAGGVSGRCGWWGNPSDSVANADLVVMIRNKEPLGLSTTGHVIPRAAKGGPAPRRAVVQAPGGHAGWEAPLTTHASYHNPLISHSHSSEYRGVNLQHQEA